jgi:hypothetical protein
MTHIHAINDLPMVKSNKKEERIRHLMSPYNLGEARRAKEFRNSIITVILVVLIGVGALIFLLRH